jgi:hypothetical protein
MSGAFHTALSTAVHNVPIILLWSATVFSYKLITKQAVETVLVFSHLACYCLSAFYTRRSDFTKPYVCLSVRLLHLLLSQAAFIFSF